MPCYAWCFTMPMPNSIGILVNLLMWSTQSITWVCFPILVVVSPIECLFTLYSWNVIVFYTFYRLFFVGGVDQLPGMASIMFTLSMLKTKAKQLPFLRIIFKHGRQWKYWTRNLLAKLVKCRTWEVFVLYHEKNWSVHVL